MPDKKEDTLLGILAGALATVGGSALVRFAAEKTGEIAKREIEKKLTDKGNIRGLLVKDLLMMGPDRTTNLRRRIEKAQVENREDQLVGLLCKLPCDEKTGRTSELERLNEATDSEFDQYIEVLKHDDLVQWARRVKQNGGPITKQRIEEFKRLLSRGVDVVTTNVPKAVPAIGSVARKIDDWFAPVADWMKR